MDSGDSANSGASPHGSEPVIPEHILRKKIAQGSYGEVWLAETVLGQWRAVKVVRRNRFPQEAPFRREMEGIRLYEPHSRNHEGLVDVLQVGQSPDADFFYYVMELADPLPNPDIASDSPLWTGHNAPSETAGFPSSFIRDYAPHTLESDLATGARLPVAECVKLGLALADALHYLHGAGLVHRDVKPANVIFVAGKPKLADPGSITDASLLKTQIGTEGFIPPEGRGSAQGDVFSLGKLLYAASTGKPATEFPNPPLDLEAWPDHQQWLELNELLASACEGDRQRRYASMADLRAELALIASGHSIRAHRSLRAKLAQARRIAATLGLIVLLVSAGGLWQRNQARHLARVAAQNHLAQAFHRVENGDLLRCLPHLVKALELTPGNWKHEEIQRFRLSRMLEYCPKLAAMGAHSDGLYLADFSPDGLQVLTASADQSARVWSAETGLPITPPVRHDNEVRHAAFDTTGRRFATASADATAQIWDARTGLPLTPSLRHPAAVSWVVFRPDDRSLATACYDGVVRVWNAETGALLQELRGHDGEVHQVEFNSAGDRIATVADDKNGRLWDPIAGRQCAALAHSNQVSCLAFSPNDRLVATGSRDGTVRLWDGRDGDGPRREFRLVLPVYHVSFSQDGRWIMAAGGDRVTRGEARVWDITTGQAVSPVLVHSLQIRHAALSPDARWLATRSTDEFVQVWEVATGRQASPPLPHSMVVRRIQFSPDGGRLLTACRDGLWRIWNLRARESAERCLLPVNGKWRFATFCPVGDSLAAGGEALGARIFRQSDGTLLRQPPSTTPAGSAQYSPDGRRLAVQLPDRVEVVDLGENHPDLQLPGVQRDPWAPSPAFSPDGSRLATTVSPGCVRLWNLITGEPTSPVLEHPYELQSLDFSRDSRLLVVGCGQRGDFSAGQRGLGEARVWETASGRLLKVLPHSASVAIAHFSPDGQLMLTGCSGGWPRQDAFLWTTRSFELCLAPLSHDDGVDAAAFSPDSSRLATGTSSGTLHLWSVSTGKPMGLPMKHSRGIQWIAFSPDGRLLASGATDFTARLWDGVTGEALSPYLQHPNFVNHVEFSPDGHLLSTVSFGYENEPSSVRLYSLEVDRRPIPELRTLAEALAGFRLDDQGAERLLDPEELGTRVVQAGRLIHR